MTSMGAMRARVPTLPSERLSKEDLARRLVNTPTMRLHRLLPLLLLLVLAAPLSGLHAAATDNSSLETWHKAARALTPGATLEIPDGAYTTKGSLKLEGLHGTEEKPITLRAANRGKAIIAGVAGFVLRDCQHVILEGFTMTHDADQQSFLLFNCQHVRVTRCTFRLTERNKPRHWEHWVTIEGTTSSHNRIDHNLFEKKVNRGSPVFVRGDDPALVCSQHDRVDHNHFRDQPYANKENGHETIRTGGNDLGASDRDSFTLIDHNLLERCSGEDEIISIKSSGNIIRHNTLINCRGAICMRLGNRSTIAANYIIATEQGPAFGGIKLYGFEHRVFNNYCYGLTGKHHEAPFILDPGTLDTPSTPNIRDKYDDSTSVAPTRCWIAHNTWIDCSPLLFGYPDQKRPCIPTDNTFTQNLVFRTGTSTKPEVNPPPGPKSKAIPLQKVDAVRDLHVIDNVGCIAASTDPDTAVTKSDDSRNAAWIFAEEGNVAYTTFEPHMRLTPGQAGGPALWRLAAPLKDPLGHLRKADSLSVPSLPIPSLHGETEATKADKAAREGKFAIIRKANAVRIAELIKEDIFGRTRATPFEAGAEQFTTIPPTAATRLLYPLTPADVGPDAP